MVSNNKDNTLRDRTNSYQLVIFDVDGTLVDSFDLFIEIMNIFSSKYSYEYIGQAHVEYLRGLSPCQIRKALGLSIIQTFRLMFDCKNEIRKREQSPRLIEGIENLIIQLKNKNIKLAIVTSNSKENCQKYLGQSLYHLFDWVEGNSSIYSKSKKIKKIIKYSGIAQKNVIYVGDQIVDIQSAHQNKIAAAAVVWGFNSETALMRENPEYMIQEVSQLERVLLLKPNKFS